MVSRSVAFIIEISIVCVVKIDKKNTFHNQIQKLFKFYLQNILRLKILKKYDQVYTTLSFRFADYRNSSLAM